MRIFVLIAFALLVNTLCAQQYKHVDKTKTPNNVTFACNFFGNSNSYKPVSASAVTDEKAEKWMDNIVEQITSICGLQNRFIFKAMYNYNNCSAVCFSNDIGQDRFIQFDRAFLEEYEKKTGDKWFVTGVVAHEIGHHLNGHSLDGVGSRPTKEIEADEFAGFVLKKLGASLPDAQAVFSFMNDTDGPPTHPVKKLRYEAIKRGWDKASGKVSLATLVLNSADVKNFAVRNLMLSRREFDLDKKMTLVNQALTDVPGYAEALSEKGLIWLKKGKLDSAEFYCAKALLLEPYISLLILNMATVQFKKNKLTEAKAFIDDAIYFKPVYPAAYQLLSEINLSEKDYNAAAANAELGLNMNPQNQGDKADLVALMASSYYYLGKYKDAYDLFQAAKKLNPYNVRTILLMDEAKAKAGQ